MANINDTVLRHAEKLWQFHCMDNRLDNADIVLALGSHDTRVAVAAASLVLQGLAPVLVVSGGHGKVTTHTQQISESEQFVRIAETMGVSRDAIVVESEATNTGDNFRLSRELMRASATEVNAAICVTKPYMARRAFATGSKQWPDTQWQVSSPLVSFASYATKEVPQERMIQLMVGDLQRLWVYAERGFQTSVNIPAEVMAAYHELVGAGFTQFVLDE